MVTSDLPSALYRAADVRELDRLAIEDYGVPGLTLMERAGQALYQTLMARWPGVGRVALACGSGNNAGDGYVLARLLRERGLEARVLAVGDPDRLQGDARAAAERHRTAGGIVEAFSPERLRGVDVVVDALLGTGLVRPVEGRYREAIEAINAVGVGTLAVDLPSGLDADTGRVLGVAVAATVTVSFIGLKQGLFTGEGPAQGGELRFADLDVHPDVYRHVAAAAQRITPAALVRLAPRRRTAHKGHFGHVLVVGGELGMAGAPRLAGEAAARTGAGLVSVATRAAHAGAISGGRPELMAHPVEDTEALAPLLARASVVALGPGLGRSAWGRAVWVAALEAGLPAVVDADALNLLADEHLRRDDWVLTPHPGEAGRLLGTSAAEVQADRFAAARELNERFGGTAVLKGAGTLVRDPGGAVAVCDRGNPGMAAGGMGDVLTGVIAGLIAQGLGPDEAAQLGVFIHAAAGDAAAGGGERGVLASDVIARLREWVNPGPG